MNNTTHQLITHQLITENGVTRVVMSPEVEARRIEATRKLAEKMARLHPTDGAVIVAAWNAKNPTNTISL